MRFEVFRCGRSYASAPPPAAEMRQEGLIYCAYPPSPPSAEMRKTGYTDSFFDSPTLDPLSPQLFHNRSTVAHEWPRFDRRNPPPPQVYLGKSASTREGPRICHVKYSATHQWPRISQYKSLKATDLPWQIRGGHGSTMLNPRPPASGHGFPMVNSWRPRICVGKSAAATDSPW